MRAEKSPKTTDFFTPELERLSMTKSTPSDNAQTQKSTV